MDLTIIYSVGNSIRFLDNHNIDNHSFYCFDENLLIVGIETNLVFLNKVKHYLSNINITVYNEEDILF